MNFNQVSFLFLCVEHSGKVDFGAVGRDYEKIHGEKLSSSAAYKRFKRLKEKMEREGEGSSRKSDGGSRVKVEGEEGGAGKKRNDVDKGDHGLRKKVKREVKEEWR
jgi:Myb-like DNA-binding domain